MGQLSPILQTQIETETFASRVNSHYSDEIQGEKKKKNNPVGFE